MERRAYKLIPRSGLHLGREGLEQESDHESFPSDSLFAALVSAQAQRSLEQLGQLLEGLPIDEGAGTAQIRLSSLFPLVGDLMFFPRPRLRIETGDAEAEISGKKLKKTSYVSQGVLEAILRGKANTQDWKKGLFIQNGTFWLTHAEQGHLPEEWRKVSADKLNEKVIFKSDNVTRVSVDRQTSFSSVYEVARTRYAKACGLWLMVESDAQRQDLIYSLLEDLQDRGIGAERSSGYGSFDLASLTLADSLRKATEGRGHGLLLSRYNPKLSELEQGVLGEQSAYELVDVGGWLYSVGQVAQRRQRLRLVEAGSVLDLSQVQQIHGRVVDVRPRYDTAQFPHPVYRSGLALTL